MKFQNPSLNFFLNGRTHARTHGRTHTRTDKPKPICSPLFQSWGHNETKLTSNETLSDVDDKASTLTLIGEPGVTYQP